MDACNHSTVVQGGARHKAFEPLEVISWYSQKKTHSKVKSSHKNKFQPLTFHNLSLHNDANTRNYVAKPSQQNMNPKSTHTLPTGPHRAMRESRTATDKVAVSGNQHESQKTLKRKCRSVTALINRRVRRSLKGTTNAFIIDESGRSAMTWLVRQLRTKPKIQRQHHLHTTHSAIQIISILLFTSIILIRLTQTHPLTHFTKITFFSTKS